MMVGSMGTITHTTRARRPQSPSLVEMMKVNQGQDGRLVSYIILGNFRT